MKKHILVSLLVVLALPAFAKNYDSSFIEDMPKLSASEADASMLEWTAEGVTMAAYGSVHLPQPVIILSEKNKYKGMQPDQLKLLADRVQAVFTSRFGDFVDVVDVPRGDTLVMNIAVTDIVMKKKRGLLSFTPVGAVTHAAMANNKIEDVEKLAEKIQLKDANLEIELVDAASGELVGVRVLMFEGKEKGREEESWKGLRAEIEAAIDRVQQNYTAALAATPAAE